MSAAPVSAKPALAAEEYKMKVTKRQLQRIIAEEKQKLVAERVGPGAMYNLETNFRRAMIDFVADYMDVMEMEPANKQHVNAVRMRINDVVSQVLGDQ